jgi:predicted ATPase
MIRRLYIHNFRCLENFELPISNQSSLLLIGKNGAGKTTVGLGLEILQRIARGTNRVGDLVKLKDLRRADAPVRFEVEVELSKNVYKYTIGFEYPQGFRELRVLDEKLTVDGSPVYAREIAQVQLARLGQEREANFRIDWHLVALPIVQQQSASDPLFIFRQRLASILILRPLPSLIRGDSDQETLQPNIQVTNLGAWFSGLLASAPSAYTKIDAYLKQVMPDLQDMKNPTVGKELRTLVLEFSNKQGGSVTVPFEDLSDGEKCFMICALVIATNDVYGPLLCFWDDPDNYLAPSEVGLSVMALRQAFQANGQLIATSHNPEAIRRFSDENTLVLYRNSHLEPTIARPLEKIRAGGELTGDLIDALVRGDVGA